ncbi:MAG: TrkA C-terminal domain-containing protein [Proteocatella sp.]
MDNKIKISTTRYQQIAADIASKIADGNYKVGDKVYARSALASQYGVSSETARRAVCVLSDLGIVDSAKGSGVLIKSYENAVKYVKQHQDVQSINELKQNLINSVERQKKEMEIFNGCLNDLIDKTEHFRSINPFVPFQILITHSTEFLNKSISDINFWHNTAATIIAIKRNNSILMSPGPYATLSENDILYFVGDDSSLDRVKNFLYQEK